MTPSFTWRGREAGEDCIPTTSDSTVQYPQHIPFGEACWSHVDVVGEVVTLPFLLHVLSGDLSYVKEVSGNKNAKVISVSSM